MLDESKAPFYRWFVGGKTNLSYNCLDRHLDSPTRHKAALVWEGEPGDRRVLTYGDLARDVCVFANALKKLGLRKGDRVAIYLPMTPELVISMLACARIGAVHTVIFAGFSAESIRDRVQDCQAKLVITGDGGWRRGKVLPLKDTVDEALADAPSVKYVVVVRRNLDSPFPCHMKDGRDQWYHEVVDGVSSDCPPGEDGQRGLALSPLHERNDGQTEGHRPHHRWLHGVRVSHDEVRLRHATRRHVLVHGRHRLGDGAQLHRLRAAAKRRDVSRVRGRPRLSRPRTLLADDRALPRERFLHGADGDSRVHEMGRRMAREVRPFVAAAFGQRGRAHQSGSMDVVPEEHRLQEVSRSSIPGGRPRPVASRSHRCRE